jgi:Skp family chaperone for outer membrane proteins
MLIRHSILVRHSILCAALLAAILAVPARAEDAHGLKIAVCNPARIFNDMQETKTLQSKMVEEQNKFVASAHEREAAMEQLKKARNDFKPDHPQYSEANDKLMQATVEYKVWGESQRALAQHMRKREMKMLFEKIQAAVAEIARKENIDLVFADSRDPLPDDLDPIDINQLRGMILQKDVLYASDKIDISQKVLTLLEARYKAGAVAGNK